MSRNKVFDTLIFHVDMDAFFASVEELEHPEYRGKPLIVGGVDSGRGVVSSASYAARVYGIHAAMPIREARVKCPHGIYVNGQHKLYSEYSRRLMNCLSEFSPMVEQISIDEAFLDMTGTETYFGSPRQAAEKMKTYIRQQVGLTASVGIAANKFLAKLASDLEKPDGLTILEPDQVQSILDPLSVGKLWGVGKKTQAELHQMGFYFIKQLRITPPSGIKAHFGEAFAEHMLALCNGIDNREVDLDRSEKSISHEMTFEKDIAEVEALRRYLLELCDRVSRRARKEGLAGKTLSFVWRDSNFSRHSRSKTLAEPTHNSQEIFRILAELFKEISEKKSRNSAAKFRLIGVRLSQFQQEDTQLSLLAVPNTEAKLDKAMDAVRDKFGEAAISRGRVLPLG